MSRPTAPGFPGLPPPTRSSPPPLTIHDMGDELFGQAWPRQLAQLFGVDPRSLQRIANGQNEPHPGLLRDVAELLALVRRFRAAAAADKARRAKEHDVSAALAAANRKTGLL